jgi:predicted RNA-binding protein with PUA-like domain
VAHWLMKSEPESYGWADLVRDGGTEWDGVRNNAARLHLRAMKAGDEALFYQSMEDRSVVGIMRITGTGQPDGDDGSWVKVPVEPVRPLAKPVTLAAIKASTIDRRGLTNGP